MAPEDKTVLILLPSKAFSKTSRFRYSKVGLAVLWLKRQARLTCPPISRSTTRPAEAFQTRKSTMKTPRCERGPVPISGYLHKMKSTERLLASQWNKRYFTLEGKELKYYQHESSTEASKVIDLLSIESIRRFENGDHGVFSFVLKTPDRSYFLRAESKGDMKRWVRGLKDQQDLWRAKEEKGSVAPDPTARKPKHYSDIPAGTLLSQRSSTSLRV